MFKVRPVATILAGCVLAVVPALAQEEVYRSEASVEAFGSFVKATTQDGIRQNATDSGGLLATYRYFFNRNFGLETNYGYSLNTQSYRTSGGSVNVKSYSHEATAAYVFRVPFRRWSAFALAGAGALMFAPKNAPSLDMQARSVFVYGAGADMNLTRHLFLRGEYRGLLYNSPTWDVPTLALMDRYTHRAEPCLGLGYRF